MLDRVADMNPKNKMGIAAAIGAAAFMVFLASASALTMQGVLDYGTRHSGNGGEFNFASADFNPSTMGYKASTIANGGFETFCVERNEYFNPGSTYYYSISSAAMNGGVSGGNPDPISQGTAYLYSMFANGTLNGYNYSVGSGGNASAGLLQQAIWWLEGEISTQDLSNPFENAAVTMFGSAANAMLDNNGLYGVAVLNIWGNPQHTQYGQDQLILSPVPDGGATAVMLGVGLLGLFLAGQRFRAVRVRHHPNLPR